MFYEIPIALKQLFTAIFIICACLPIGDSKEEDKFVEMKIVDEPSSYGLNYNLGIGDSENTENKLKTRVEPANFSGPAHFQRLVGRCFSSVINNYKWDFCPYANVTQHEQGVYWNAYNGVLGVWQEWEVDKQTNNRYEAMLMKDGDKCGQVYRSVRVVFKCGNSSKILNASEPTTCKYSLEFQTPLVCHPDSMLVYPSLKTDLRDQWDNLEAEMEDDQLTLKGYYKRLREIFESGGVYMAKSDHDQLLQSAEKKKQEKQAEGEFTDLDTCKSEYKKLKEERNALILELENLHAERVNEQQMLDSQSMDD